MSEMPPNGTTGLHHTDNRWLLAEAKSLREMYQAERERRRFLEEQLILLNDKMRDMDYD